jgi:hypothetical protein
MKNNQTIILSLVLAFSPAVMAEEQKQSKQDALLDRVSELLTSPSINPEELTRQERALISYEEIDHDEFTAMLSRGKTLRNGLNRSYGSMREYDLSRVPTEYNGVTGVHKVTKTGHLEHCHFNDSLPGSGVRKGMFCHKVPAPNMADRAHNWRVSYPQSSNDAYVIGCFGRMTKPAFAK